MYIRLGISERKGVINYAERDLEINRAWAKEAEKERERGLFSVSNIDRLEGWRKREIDGGKKARRKSETE